MDLIQQCQGGDRQALGALVREYQRPVFNAVYRMLGNADEAADVTQTAFLKALEKIEGFNREHRFFSWIYRIAINESIDHLQRAQRFAPLPDAPLVAPSSVSDDAIRDQANTSLQAALMGLQEDHRTVIILRHFTDCSYDEIAGILDIPPKTVKSRLFSARQQLRQRLEEIGVFSA